MTPALFDNIFLSLLKTKRSENRENLEIVKKNKYQKNTHWKIQSSFPHMCNQHIQHVSVSLQSEKNIDEQLQSIDYWLNIIL